VLIDGSAKRRSGYRPAHQRTRNPVSFACASIEKVRGATLLADPFRPRGAPVLTGRPRRADRHFIEGDEPAVTAIEFEDVKDA